MTENKIKEQFHYYNIQADVDSVFGNWAVSKDGDVVNSLYPYAIFSIHLNDFDWMVQSKKKIWFKRDCEDDFLQALKRAQEVFNK